jgi:hypothetical protein
VGQVIGTPQIIVDIKYNPEPFTSICNITFHMVRVMIFPYTWRVGQNIDNNTVSQETGDLLFDFYDDAGTHITEPFNIMNFVGDNPITFILTE